MGFLSRAFDLLMAAYFVVHFPITILVDSQSLVPRKYFPQFAVEAVDNHVKDNGDHLVGTNPLWFKTYVLCELILQLPVFLPLAYGLLRNKAWVRMPCIIYGTHVATTVMPMLAEFLMCETPGVPSRNMVGFAFYWPFFILPLSMVVRMIAFPVGEAAEATPAIKAKTE